MGIGWIWALKFNPHGSPEDGAPAHRARDTVTMQQREMSAFIPPEMWPPNSPDLNPVDYSISGMLQEKVYRSWIHDVS